jgi:hypothetical protein
MIGICLRPEYRLEAIHPTSGHSSIWPKHRPKAEAEFRLAAFSGHSSAAAKFRGRVIFRHP